MATQPSKAAADQDAAPSRAEQSVEAFRDALEATVTIPRERLQDAVDDAVRRGRMTRGDAEDLMGLVRQEQGFAASAKRFPLKGTCLAICSRVVNSQRPLAEDVQLHEAPFWTPSLACFLREAITLDADWAEVAVELTAELRARH